MADRPIIFSAPMVRALLAGTKTQTRRRLKPQPESPRVGGAGLMRGRWVWRDGYDGFPLGPIYMPFEPGDRLWVREAFTCEGQSEGEALFRATVDDDTGYYTEEIAEIRWRSPIHMPRWASRLTLIVTDVRVQRLQDISEEDAVAEGCNSFPVPEGNEVRRMSARDAFGALWNSLHGPDAWGANPWVCAISFTVHRCNIDHVGIEDA